MTDFYIILIIIVAIILTSVIGGFLIIKLGKKTPNPIFFIKIGKVFYLVSIGTFILGVVWVLYYVL